MYLAKEKFWGVRKWGENAGLGPFVMCAKRVKETPRRISPKTLPQKVQNKWDEIGMVSPGFKTQREYDSFG